MNRALRPFRTVLCSSVLVLLLVADRATAGDAALERVEALVAAGASGLALRALDEAGRALAPDDARWEAYERRRLELYRSLKEPGKIAARIAALPANASPGLHRYATSLLAEARIEAGDAGGARELLAAALEGTSGAERAAVLARLAALELHSGRLSEAEALLDRAGASSPDTGRLRAEIGLRSGRPREALAHARALEGPEGRLMLLAAELRAKARRPAEVLAEAQRLAQAPGTESGLRRAAWLLRAEAARSAGQTVREVSALEQAFALPDSGRHVYLRASGEDLWAAYRRLAEAVGRSAGLRAGDDAAWLSQARAYSPEEGYYARALYAFVARAGETQAQRDAAHGALADSLMVSSLPATLEALYPPADRAAAPTAVRERLLDAAFARRDYKTAVSLMDTLPVPTGDDAPRWRLRRARTLLYAGYQHEALVLLSGLLDEPRFDEGFAAAYLQVVFDLQTLDLHEQALVLLEGVYGRAHNARMRRELLYWQADSLAALGRHAEAAERYLLSASYAGASSSDTWGQAARFRAAEALGRARLVADARSVYASLLKQTSDPARRAAIEQQMQQLWLAGHTTMP